MKTVIKSSSLLVLFFFTMCTQPNKLNIEGKLKRETISLAPKYAGRINKILVSEGTLVNKGDTLAIIEIPEIEAKMAQAEGVLLAATNQYNMAVKGATAEQKQQVEAAYNAALEQFKLAEKTLNRIRNLYNDSLVSPQNYDEALTKFQMARAQYDATLAKKQEVMGGLRSEQVQMALGQKKQAEGAVREAMVVMNERYLTAPASMTIETIALREGELALPGYNLFVATDNNSTYFRFTVTESQIMNFKTGQNYTINTVFGNIAINVKLLSINELARYGTRTSSYPNHQPGETVYELKFAPTKPLDVADLPTNFSVRITDY